MAAEPIDERYDEIVRGLRALPSAPAELRGRVLELAAVADTPRPRRRRVRGAVVFALLVVAAGAAVCPSLGGGPRDVAKGCSGGVAAFPGNGATERMDQSHA